MLVGLTHLAHKNQKRHQGGNENESMTNTIVILSTETTSNQLSLKESKTFIKSVSQMKEPEPQLYRIMYRTRNFALLLKRTVFH